LNDTYLIKNDYLNKIKKEREEEDYKLWMKGQKNKIKDKNIEENMVN
jgi:hypothetical protein